ncbi:MAG TPA: MarR family transcriptional regulator [Gammaproteobacteria bacterium]|nr:MarR family transcriptional regulator [Gammaproteobacteria bacterium]
MSTLEGLLSTRSGTADTAVHARPDPRHATGAIQVEFHTMATCIKLLRTAVMHPGGARRPRVTLQQYEAMLNAHTTAEVDGLTVGGLARSLGVKHNTVVMLVNRLCAKELMVRIPSEHDHRRVHLRLTAAGTALLDGLIKADGEQASQVASRVNQLPRNPP